MPAHADPPSATATAAALTELRSRRVGLVDLDLAALCLGVNPTTAHNLACRYGEVMEGVPVLRLGRLRRVRVTDLLAALGISDDVNAA